jgi:hypothetical protein
MFLPENVRAWLYRIATPAIPLLVAYGVIEESKAPLWVAFVAAFLTSGLAAVNTSTKA